MLFHTYTWLVEVACLAHAVAIGKKYHTADELYRVLGTSVSGLGASYNDADTISSAVDDEVSQPRVKSGEDSIQIGCVDYEGGGTIAKFYANIVNTFYVSRKEDRLCFYYVALAPTNPNSTATLALEGTLSIVSPVPMATKVDPALLLIIEAPFTDLPSTLDSLNLNGTVEIAIEHFDFSENDRRTVPEGSQKRHRNLINYDLEAFNTFHVTSESRRAIMDAHRNTLAAAVEEHPERDPCTFSDIADEIHMRDQHIFREVTSYLEAALRRCRGGGFSLNYKEILRPTALWVYGNPSGNPIGVGCGCGSVGSGWSRDPTPTDRRASYGYGHAASDRSWKFKPTHGQRRRQDPHDERRHLAPWATRLPFPRGPGGATRTIHTCVTFSKVLPPSTHTHPYTYPPPVQ